MKKIILLLICGCVFLATPVMAGTCNGGTEITAKNGKVFCKSDKTMNWWTAFNWCASQGRSLANFSTMCPGVATITNNTAGACSNLQGVGGNVWVWTNVAYSTGSAYRVSLSSGVVSAYGNRNDVSSYFAFCE